MLDLALVGRRREEIRLVTASRYGEALIECGTGGNGPVGPGLTS